MPARVFEPADVAGDALLSSAKLSNTALLVEAPRVGGDDVPTPVPSARDWFGRWAEAAGRGRNLATYGCRAVTALTSSSRRRPRAEGGPHLRNHGVKPGVGHLAEARAADFLVRRTSPRPGAHLTGNKLCPGMVSGVERGTHRPCPRAGSRNAMNDLVSPVETEPTTPNLKSEGGPAFSG
jgi:hypothetical protein